MVEMNVHAAPGVPSGLPFGQPKGTQHITEYHVPNGTSRALGDTFFYQYCVPNGTLTPPLFNFWKHLLILSVFIAGLLVSCADLDVPSPTILSDADVFANENSTMLYLARLYAQMPFEDFKYSPNRQFFADWVATPDQTSGLLFNFDSPYTMVQEGNDMNGPYWRRAFASLRDANTLLEELPKYKGNFRESFYNHCIGEAYFTRAMIFYTLAKRYGGAPLVTKVLKYPEIPAAELEVPRASEEETWDQVLRDFDSAIEYLNETSPRRGLANKNVALGFKSEAMLYAGSVAKYNRITGFGTKTGVRVIGFDPGKEAALSKKYFMEAYRAGRDIMNKNRYSLYKKAWAPGNREAQYKNMVDMFFDLSSPENIYIKEYYFPNNVHSYDAYAVPLQQINGAGYSSRANPILDFVEMFDGLPKNPDGTIKVFDRDKDDPDRKYLLFDSPLDLFRDAEPRLRAYVVFPMDELRGETVDIRRGIYTGEVAGGIAPLMCRDGVVDYDISGSVNYNQVDAYRGVGAFDRQVLFTCENGYSNVRTRLTIKWANGRDTTLHASGESGPFSSSIGANGGFTIRKWLDPAKPKNQVQEGRSTQHFIVMRYAEILLNVAEAACELALAGESAPAGDDFQAIATQAIRDIRERAGADPLVGTLTLDEAGKMLIRRERQKELAYENKHLWDIRRWRTQHSDVVNGRTQQDGVNYRGLYPFYAEKAGKYFFDVRFEEHNWRFRLTENQYYFAIPGGEVSKSPVIDQQPNL